MTNHLSTLINALDLPETADWDFVGEFADKHVCITLHESIVRIAEDWETEDGQEADVPCFVCSVVATDDPQAPEPEWFDTVDDVQAWIAPELARHVEALREALRERGAVRSQTLTRQGNDGFYAVELQWRPLPADEHLGAGRDAELLWSDAPPAQLAADEAMFHATVLVTDLCVRTEATQWVYAPTLVTDDDAELEPGEFRVLWATRDGESIEITILDAAEHHG